MKDWETIDKYDTLKKKPKNCVFYVEPMINEDRPYASLKELVVDKRYFGNREVTHYFQLPPLPSKVNK